MQLFPRTCWGYWYSYKFFGHVIKVSKSRNGSFLFMYFEPVFVFKKLVIIWLLQKNKHVYLLWVLFKGYLFLLHYSP